MSELKANQSNSRKLWLTFIGCFAVFIALGFAFYKGVDPKVFHNWASGLAWWLVVLILALFPLVGFPISILFVVAGAKFGSAVGMLVVAVTTAIHLLATYWITTSFLHNPVAALFKKTKYTMPKILPGEQIPVTLLTALVPGVPYTAKNYLLVLAGVPLRTFFWVCLPTHLFHASLAIFFGDLTRDLTTGRVIFLLAYALVVVILGHHVVRRLKTRAHASH